MKFFLRNISLSALVLALLVGALSVYVSGRVVYKSVLNQVFNERVRVVEIIGRVALEDNVGTTTLSSVERLQTALLRIGNKEPGLLSLRVVNTSSKEVIASVKSNEVGTIYQEDFPNSKRGVVLVEVDSKSDRSFLELSYLGSGNRLVWMVIDESFFIGPAIVTGFQQGVIFSAAFGLFAFLFFGIIRRFFTRPIEKLKSVLSAVEENNTNGDGKKKEQSFGELLESFSDVAMKVEATIGHDKVVSETKSDFISTTAHQLRTPLSGINWALGSLLSDGENLTDEQKTLVTRASEKTKELVTIVGGLLSAAGIEQGKFGFHPEEVQVQDEIEKTLVEEKELAVKNKITLRFNHENEAFPVVYVDRERIRWVVRNLVENAIRYGREGGEVAVTLKREGKKLLISVKDNGIGISPFAQQHIFEKFFRSAEAKRKRNDGSGIGLFIVRNIINYHGGRIWFESVEGVGTTFFFTIPISKETGEGKQAKVFPKISTSASSAESPTIDTA